MIPLFAAVLPVLLVFCGLAMDIGFLQSKSVAMQSAADAASSSAEVEAERGTGNWVSVGKQTAALNGYTDGTSGTTITVTRQPPSGAYAGRNDAIAVTISKASPTIFMQYLFPTEPLSVKSVALIPPCVYLNGAQSGLALSSASSTINGNCPTYINGAAQMDSGSSINTSATDLTNGSSFSGTANPTVSPNVPTLTDPLASLAQPTASYCMVTGYSQNGGSATFPPGTFCGGVTLQNATVNLMPGLYVITGGVHCTNSTINGTGVTLFFTSTSSTGFGQFIIDTGSHVTLSAPTDASNGGVPGVLVFGDRAWNPTSPQDFQILNSTVTTDGVWYTSHTGIRIAGSYMTNTHYLAMDTASLVLTGSSLTVSGDFSSLAAGNPFRPLGGVAE